MNPQRVSVSKLDTFNKYRCEVISEDELILYLAGPREESEYMRVGTAISAYFETGDPEYLADARIVPQSLADVMAPCDWEGEPEVWVSGDVGPLHVVGRLDRLFGMRALDYKAKFSTFSVDRYLDSYQWRLYLHMTGAREFLFRVFRLPPSPPYAVQEAHTIKLWTYPELASDCERLACEYADWLERAGDLEARVAEILARREEEPAEAEELAA